MSNDSNTQDDMPASLEEVASEFQDLAAGIEAGGGPRGIERQHRHGRLTARERLKALFDVDSRVMECGLLYAWNM